MHLLVRRFIKSGIIFLLVGLALGGWMMVRRELFDVFPTPYQVSAHTHAILVGFVMSMILGVALWLFPRPAKEDARYNPTHVSVAYWLLTIGTAGRVLGELMRTASAPFWLRICITVCGLLQIAGVLVFFYTMWTRIRGVGSMAREASGERF